MEMPKQEVIKHLQNVNMQIVHDMARFANKRISHEEKCANANARRLEMMALRIAIEAVENIKD